jgi:hypothetical protein
MAALGTSPTCLNGTVAETLIRNNMPNVLYPRNDMENNAMMQTRKSPQSGLFIQGLKKTDFR